MVCLTHVRRTAPTAGMDAELDLMPLDLYVQKIAVQATLRVGQWNREKRDGAERGKS